jgi:hypothetical protein
MFRIQHVHAWVSVDADDEEGIIGFMGPDRQWMPMIAADEARLRQLRPFAERTAKATGRPVRLLRFTVREELETIEAGEEQA